MRSSFCGHFASLVPLRDALRPIPPRFAVHMRSETHEAGVEDARIHEPEVARNSRPEAHTRNDVALNVESGRDLDQLQTFCANLENRALCDKKRNLPTLASHAGAIADLLQLRNELLVATFLANDSVALFPGNVEVAGCQHAAEDDASGILGDVDEPADADDPVAEAAYVDIALRVDLGERKEGQIQSSAIVEIELCRLIDHRRKILRSAGIAAGDRGTADQALFVGQMHRVEQTFFGGDRR